MIPIPSALRQTHNSVPSGATSSSASGAKPEPAGRARRAGRANQTLEPIRTPPEFHWWKQETSDPAQFELMVPHGSPDSGFQEWRQASDPAEAPVSWQVRELTLDADRTLVVDSDPPAQDEFPEFFYD